MVLSNILVHSDQVVLVVGNGSHGSGGTNRLPWFTLLEWYSLLQWFTLTEMVLSEAVVHL